MVWTEPAAEQFAERLDHIGAFNPDAARALRRKVDASLRRLLEHPERGRWVPEFGPGFYREILVRPLRILYEDHGTSLAITYVHRQEEAIGPGTFPFDPEC
ncbi:type II toxin-antitoxin system RelE/ParE family toxin [Mesoterricola silvestris]|uniref:type II toxin-antitoxin system RelE/ParE family toxin n=1 Tax=Mesoterricola silvestris TaxID=2927979 RepID=UPI00292FD66D|nr:type II toxin-antitoxin system RelE/ParE family toxin [Mesoterricola silvestris]